MSTHKQRSRRKERFWRSRVRGWRKSGLSVRAFCADQGLSEPSFYAWRRILAERGTERDTASDRTAAAFVPVRVVTTEPVTASASAADSAGATVTTVALELVLSGGRRLRVGPGFDGSTLQRLLALLEEGRS